MRISKQEKDQREMQKRLEKEWGQKPTKIVDKEHTYKPPKKKESK